MSLTVLIHFMNEDPMLAEMDSEPNPNDQFLTCVNPRRRDGKDVTYLMQDLRTLILPWHRIHCVEILSGGEQEEELLTFVRE